MIYLRSFHCSCCLQSFAFREYSFCFPDIYFIILKQEIHRFSSWAADCKLSQPPCDTSLYKISDEELGSGGRMAEDKTSNDKDSAGSCPWQSHESGLLLHFAHFGVTETGMLLRRLRFVISMHGFQYILEASCIKAHNLNRRGHGLVASKNGPPCWRECSRSRASPSVKPGGRTHSRLRWGPGAIIPWADYFEFLRAKFKIRMLPQHRFQAHLCLHGFTLDNRPGHRRRMLKPCLLPESAPWQAIPNGGSAYQTTLLHHATSHSFTGEPLSDKIITFTIF